jgi:hypothetical protein
MKNKWSVIPMLLVSMSSLCTGGWMAGVFAVCRIEMTDSTSIEGIINIASASDRYYSPNGFYLVYEYKGPDVENPVTGKQIVLFNTAFYAIIPFAGVVEHSPTYESGMGPSYRIQKAYYLHDITPKYYGGSPIEKDSLESIDSSLVLRRDFIDHSVWELLDCIPVFPKVPIEIMMGRKIQSVKELHITISKIKKLQLVLDPSESWLRQIANAKAQAENELLKEKHAEETAMPGWWHDLIKKNGSFKECFKPWQY